MTSNENENLEDRFEENIFQELVHRQQDMAEKRLKAYNRRRDILMVLVGVAIYMLWHIHKDITEIGRVLGLDW